MGEENAHDGNTPLERYPRITYLGKRRGCLYPRLHRIIQEEQERREKNDTPEILNTCIKAISTLAEHGIISSYEKSRFERRAVQEYSRKIQQQKKDDKTATQAVE